MTADAIVAPTDAQLAYIRDLCDRNGFPRPECVHSSREASEIITALRTGSYDPERYTLDADLPWALRR